MILGCGRWSVADDSAGLEVARLLSLRALPGATVLALESPGEAIADLDPCETRLLVIVDAAPATESHPAGDWVRLDYFGAKHRLVWEPATNTHALGVAEGLELAAALGRSPECVWIYVLLGETFERGMSRSPAVDQAIPGLADRMEHDVRDWLATRSCTSSLSYTTCSTPR